MWFFKSIEEKAEILRQKEEKRIAKELKNNEKEINRKKEGIRSYENLESPNLFQEQINSYKNILEQREIDNYNNWLKI